MNNPIKYTDPTGHYICEDLDNCEPPPGDEKKNNRGSDKTDGAKGGVQEDPGDVVPDITVPDCMRDGSCPPSFVPPPPAPEPPPPCIYSVGDAGGFNYDPIDGCAPFVLQFYYGLDFIGPGYGDFEYANITYRAFIEIWFTDQGVIAYVSESWIDKSSATTGVSYLTYEINGKVERIKLSLLVGSGNTDELERKLSIGFPTSFKVNIIFPRGLWGVYQNTFILDHSLDPIE